MLRKEIKRKPLMNLRKNLLNVRSDSNILYIYIYIFENCKPSWQVTLLVFHL